MHIYELPFFGSIYTHTKVGGGFLQVGGANDIQFYPFIEFDIFCFVHVIIHNNKLKYRV